MSVTRNRPLTFAAISSIALAVSMLAFPSQAATSGRSAQPHAATARGGDATQRTPGNVDARSLQGTPLVKASRQQVAQRTKADAGYYRSLGTRAVADLDPLTHTVRDLGRLNGYLTGRSSSPAQTVALSYVRQHLGALGLTQADLDTLRFRQDYVDPLGLHHLSWTQSVRGATVFGNGLKVAVTRDGRVLEVQGSPVSGLERLAAAAPAGSLSRAAARTKAAANVQGRLQPGAGGYAKKVWFLTSDGLRPGWSTYVQTTNGSFQHVVDARSGRVLYRHSTINDANGDALVYDNYPGANKGGQAKVVNFFKRGWLNRDATFLEGASVTAFSDVNDDNAIQESEKTPVPGTNKGGKKGAEFPLSRFGAEASSFCTDWVCTWNPNQVGSWQVNRNADTTNAFYLASNFHDYLEQSPISFTAAAGNFERQGGDPVMLNTLDGANTNAGMPDGNHIDNANMSTPPDGFSPRMQMYLFHFPGASDDPATGDPFVPTTGSFDASVLYHEYTHGLSNRLVIDANGNSTLDDIQPGSMGEAWSDYYAMDYLVTKGFLTDTKEVGNLLEGEYVAAGQHLIRTMAVDCPVGATSDGCTSGFDGRTGGYTYGDFPTIVGGPEVHGSGEIWAQTLWDLRKALGHKLTDSLVTRAMSISANDPSFLDMRDAILRADLVGYGAEHQGVIWQVFAGRGMGFFAGAIDGADTTPGEDFHTPPPAGTPHNGVVAGTVTDPTTGEPVQGAVVQVTGQGDQYTTRTNADGRYAIGGLVIGTYAKVAASGAGYIGDAKAGEAVVQSPSNPTTTTDFEIVRDWAASSGGGAVTDFDGPDFTPFGCGPRGAIDLSLSTGWGSTTGNDAGQPTNVFVPKSITLALPQAVDISSFGIDPTATCGDGGSASTGAYKIETSTDGSTFTEVASGEFTADDRGRLNEVLLSGGDAGVQFVKFTILGNQTPNFDTNCPNGAFSGCSFTDLTEIAVFGSPSA